MSNKKSIRQPAKRILALILSLMLMNTTIANFAPTRVMADEGDVAISFVDQVPDGITSLTIDSETEAMIVTLPYSGTNIDLKGDDGKKIFTWNSEIEGIEVDIKYYSDEARETMLSASDESGATEAGGAPRNAERCYATITLSKTVDETPTTLGEQEFIVDITAVQPNFTGTVKVKDGFTIYDTTKVSDVQLEAADGAKVTGVMIGDTPEEVEGHFELVVDSDMIGDNTTGKWRFYADGEFDPETKKFDGKNYSSIENGGDISFDVRTDTLTGLEIKDAGEEESQKYKTSYNYGETLDLSNMKVVETYESSNTWEYTEEDIFECFAISTNLGKYTKGDKLTAKVNKITIAKNCGEITKEASYNITVAPKNVSTPEITLDTPDDGYTYCGAQIKPDILSVKDGETIIPADEYAVSYSNNTNAGTATVTITDKEGGDYTFEETTTSFTIEKKEITVEADTYKVSKEYNGTVDAGTGEGELAVSGILPADAAVGVRATPQEYSSSECQSSTGNVTLELTGEGATNYKLKYSSIEVPYIITKAELEAVTSGTVQATGTYGTVLSNLTVSGLSAQY